MQAGILCFSPGGQNLAQTLRKPLEAEGFHVTVKRCRRGQLRAITARFFAAKDLLIFIGSCGLAVRAIAPYVVAKDQDPAVLVMDEKADFVIPLLSGHLGGANHYARYLADRLDASAVITTASDVWGLFAVDEWARVHGLHIVDTAQILPFASAYLAGKTMSLYSEFPVSSALPERIQLTDDARQADFFVLASLPVRSSKLTLIPPCYSLGIGCRKGTEVHQIQAAISEFLSDRGIPEAAITRLASIDLKAQEPGLLAYAAAANIPFVTFPAETLQAVVGNFSHSDFVLSVTGVSNVCERASLADLPGAHLQVSKTVVHSITLALTKIPYTLDFTC